MIKIVSQEPIFSANERGEFYRVLLPGAYNISVWFSCDMQVYSTQVTLKSKRNRWPCSTLSVPDELRDFYHRESSREIGQTRSLLQGQTNSYVSQQTVFLFDHNSWRRLEATAHFALELPSFVHLELTINKFLFLSKNFYSSN